MISYTLSSAAEKILYRKCKAKNFLLFLENLQESNENILRIELGYEVTLYFKTELSKVEFMLRYL